MDTPPTDLSQYCLEKDLLDSRRGLAWANSICLVFLVIGIAGLKPRAAEVTRKPAMVAEVVPTVIEPLVPAIQHLTADSGAAAGPTETTSGAGGPVVAVTVDSSAVAFAVPTVGNVLVPLGKAQPPPAQPLAAVVPLSSVQFETVQATGLSGSRPAPSYPTEALRRREQGQVTLVIDVDAQGRVTAVTIKESSGFSRLDQAAVDQIRRRWFFPPSSAPRKFECPIIFQLQ
ncbi:MAG: hypothetical protein PCFJNLEI_00583 [Verrucomicrobiae bacterium]|nr:hypothetical protein [Verrucomicrobiae bacterium]